MKTIAVALTTATTCALLLAAAIGTAAVGDADDDGAPRYVSASPHAGWAASPAVSAQGDEDGSGQAGVGDTAAENEDRVGVQVWTVTAAGAAMSVGLLLFLLRVVMGWVKPPPDPERVHH